MKIPVFGRIIVCACGVICEICLYSVINGLTGGWLSNMRKDSPVQWWLTVIIAGLFLVGAHWLACPSPHSNGTILGDDEDTIAGFDYTPSYSSTQNEPTISNAECITIRLDDIIGAFNSTQARYKDIVDKIGAFGYDKLPQEFLEISQNASTRYDILENRMRSYMDLFNDSSASWRDEVGADVLQKIESANAAIGQLESAFRLLNQTSDNNSVNSRASFFRGCNTIDELNRRYRNLAKTFHPDLEAGDEETMKQVNEEYERLKSEFTSNNL